MDNTQHAASNAMNNPTDAGLIGRTDEAFQAAATAYTDALVAQKAYQASPEGIAQQQQKAAHNAKTQWINGFPVLAIAGAPAQGQGTGTNSR